MEALSGGDAEYAKFLWFIPQPPVAESGHSKDKLVTSAVFIGSSFSLRQQSKAVALFCCCAFHVFSHLKVDMIGQYDYELSVPSKEREREKITCCHDNKR